MPYTQTDIDTLKTSIASGALEVEFGSGTERRRVKYRSLADMRSTLAEMIAEVSPSTSLGRVTYIEHDRG